MKKVRKYMQTKIMRKLFICGVAIQKWGHI